MNLVKIEGHTFNPDLISKNGLVIDIGGNTGIFSQDMIYRYGYKVVCYEPDRAAFDLLKRIKSDNFKVINKAVAKSSGRRPFYSAQPLNGGNSLIPGCREMGRYGKDEVYEVDTISFEEVLSPHEVVDLVKIDAEGAEFEIIMGTNPTVFKKIQQLTIEFHDFAFNQFSVKDIDECIQWLESLGFKSKYVHGDPDRDYYFYRN